MCHHFCEERTCSKRWGKLFVSRSKLAENQIRFKVHGCKGDNYGSLLDAKKYMAIIFVRDASNKFKNSK